MPTNEEPKQTITPGQALLILIDQNRNNPEKYDELKRLYLSGATSDSSRNLMNEVFKDKALRNYNISTNPYVINADPTRRYFETHLSYETVTQELNNVSQTELEDHLRDITDMIPTTLMQKVQHVLNGEYRDNDNLLFKEYSDYIYKIKNGKVFQSLTQEEKDKVVLIVKIAFLGVYNAQNNPGVLPLNIYGTGIYSESAKGKILDPYQSETRNQQLGLMKGHMPLSVNDIALLDSPLPYLKPSDQSKFNPDAEWVKSNFDAYVHPFSNSISGTMLCQLRNLAKFEHESHRNPFYSSHFTQSQQKMRSFTKLFISTMLYGSGGHTLNEYSAPLSIPIIKNEFSNVIHDDLTLESLFYPNASSPYQQTSNSFDDALEKTIAYNKHYINKRKLNAEIRGNITTSAVTPSEKAVEYLKRNQNSREKEELKDLLASPLFIQWGIRIPVLKTINSKVESNSYTEVTLILDKAMVELETTVPTLPQSVIEEGKAFMEYLKNRINLLENTVKPSSYYKTELNQSKVNQPKHEAESNEEGYKPIAKNQLT